MPEEPQNSSSFGDLWRMVRRRRRALFSWIIFFGLLAATGALLRPVRYQAEASFLDRAAQGNALQGTQSIIGALAGLTNEGGNQATVEIFKSKRLLQTLAQKYSLQASFVEAGLEPTLLKRAQDNLNIEKAYWQKQIPPLHSLPTIPFTCTVIDYKGNLPNQYQLQFKANKTFQIITPQGPIEGRLGRAIKAEDFTLTLQCPDSSKLPGREFVLTLSPLADVSEQLFKLLDVCTHRECPDLVLLTLQYPDQHLVSTLLNDLMESYRSYLDEQNQELARGQLAYLDERKRNATEELHKILAEHALTLTKGVQETGILSAKAETNQLSAARAKTQQLLLEIDSELRLLEKINPSDPNYIQTLATANHLPAPIANSIKQIQALHLRTDCLRRALQQPDRITTPIPSDMKGIDLEMANRLYLTHADKLNTLEINQRQNNFILEQLQDPAFEVSSISGAVQDSVSADIIKRSAQATLELKETDYRSQRELERVRKRARAGERIPHLTPHPNKPPARSSERVSARKNSSYTRNDADPDRARNRCRRQTAD